MGWRITGEKKMLHLTTKRKVHAKGEKGNCQGLVNSIKKQRLAVKAGRSDLTSQHGKNKTQWCLESWKQKREDRYSKHAHRKGKQGEDDYKMNGRRSWEEMRGSWARNYITFSFLLIS